MFVYSDEEQPDYKGFGGAQHILRTLMYGSDGSTALIGRDREFADWLWRLNGHVGVLKALQVGDRIEIVDGVFKQLRGTITKMDRRRKTVRVDLDTEGLLRHIWLAYEIVDRVEEDTLQPDAKDSPSGLEQSS